MRKPELVHVYVPSGDKSPGRIVKWEELMEDAELCKQLFWLTTSPRTLSVRKVKYNHNVKRTETRLCLPPNRNGSQDPTHWKGFVEEKGEDIWQRPLKRSHNFSKSEIECQNICQIECQKECQIGCKIEVERISRGGITRTKVCF